ncbi:MAG: DUF1501 domain-containing protein [Planctomycetota bacterium]
MTIPLKHDIARRVFLKQAAVGALSTPLARQLVASESGYRPLPPAGNAEHCVFIWLGGGMSQIDTFDPKRRGDPKKRTPGSDYAAIETVVPGVQVCEHLPQIAERMDRVTAVRTVHHDVVDEHAAATNRVHTGRPTTGTIVYPSIGSIVANQRGAAGDGVPAYVLIGYPNVTRSSGFLGAKDNFLYLTDTQQGPAGLARPDFVTDERASRRSRLLDSLRAGLRAQTGWQDASSMRSYDEALLESRRLSGPEFMSVFDLDREPDDLRNRYDDEFGQRCLLTRRLIERGVRFIEVSHNLNFVNGTGWDTHNEGQRKQHLLIRQLDNAVATLMDDLESKKLLDRTLIVIGSEFGRPAGFDSGGGRGHQGSTFTMVLAGGGLNHCGAYGETDELSKTPVEHPVSIPDFHATVHRALGIDPTEMLYAGERPVPITDGGYPIASLFET